MDEIFCVDREGFIIYVEYRYAVFQCNFWKPYPLFTHCVQPPPQALRFSHRRGEHKTQVTGDEPQGTMGRVQTVGEALPRPLSPSRLPLRGHFMERERRLDEAALRL